MSRAKLLLRCSSSDSPKISPSAAASGIVRNARRKLFACRQQTSNILAPRVTRQSPTKGCSIRGRQSPDPAQLHDPCHLISFHTSSLSLLPRGRPSENQPGTQLAFSQDFTDYYSECGWNRFSNDSRMSQEYRIALSTSPSTIRKQWTKLPQPISLLMYY